MFTKIMKVFYAKDNLPYKDQERQVHFPITGGSFLGASNVTEIRFYIDQIGDSSDTWVANAKLPNGKMGSKILQTFTDTEIGEHYAKLDFSSYYTQAKGDVYISLNGFYGGVQITQSGGVYSIEGIPTIQATGVVKIAVNYATPLISGDEVETMTLQQIFAMFGTKLNKNDNRYLKVVPTISSINTVANQEIISAGDVIYELEHGTLLRVNGTYPNYTVSMLDLSINNLHVEDKIDATNLEVEGISTTTITLPTFSNIKLSDNTSLPTWLTENYVDRSTNQDINGNKTFKGETLFSDNVVFDEDVDFESKVKFSDTIIGGLTPETTSNANIGTSSHMWKDFYLSGELSDGTNEIAIADIVTKNTAQAISGEKSFTSEVDFSDLVVFDGETHFNEPVLFEGTISLNNDINGDLLPLYVAGSSNPYRDIGSSTQKWGDLYLHGDMNIDGEIVQGNLSIPIPDIATKDYVGNVISTVRQNSFLVVESLPERPEEGIIYLILIDSERPEDGYYEYIYEGNDWLLIGATTINLSNYYTIAQTNALLSGKADKSDTYTKTETNTLLSGKQDLMTAITTSEWNTMIGD